MKKLLLAVCLVLISSVASADYWKASQSLLPGKYMIIEVDRLETARIEYMRTLSPGIVEESQMDVLKGLSGIIIQVTKDYNVNGLIKYLMTEPMTDSDYNPMFFYWDEAREKWTNMPFPCRYVVGDAS
jgi:hypothetical protein